MQSQPVTIIPQGSSQWLVPSASRPGTVYVVRRISDNRVQCDCLGAIHHGHCYHERAIMDHLTAARTDAIREIVRTHNPLLTKSA